MSSLRVFEPLYSFESAERRRWTLLITGNSAPTPREADIRERRALLPAVAGGTLDFRRLDIDESAMTASWNGSHLICPLDTKPRALQAIIDSEWKLPYPLNDWSMNRQVRRHAASLQAHPSATRARGKQHILTCNWRVPVWWCALFATSDQVRDPSTGGETTFRTPIQGAIDRAESALQTMVDSFGEADMTADLDSLHEWLRGFHEGSVVEMDYGGLSAFLPGEEKQQDQSVELVAKSLAHLAVGDTDKAIFAYHEFTEIWEEIARLESWN